MTRLLAALPIASGPAALAVRRDLLAMLDGNAAYLPVPANDRSTAEFLASELGVGQPIDGECVLVIPTSGSTGTPKGAMHTAASLRASAEATADALGGPGAWLLTLPPHHIAGLQVLLRSLAAGHQPVVMDVTDGFDPALLPVAVDALDGPRRYTSLVPLQLRKALEHPAAVTALASLDAILVGGAATPPDLAHAARDAGLPILRTYGMSETAGGCVYDGVPLSGAAMRIDAPNPDGVGRVELGGPTVALGYRNGPSPAFAEPGWFRTDDLGAIDNGVLRIVGRADEAISTGGLTVVPQAVEAAIDSLDSVAACAVFGVPDERLGQAVAAAVVLHAKTPSIDSDIHNVVTQRLDRYAVPRRIIVVDELPTRGPGKTDRRALAERYGRNPA